MKKKILLISIALSFAVVFYDWLRMTSFSSDWVRYIRHFNHLASLFGFVLMFYLFIFSSKMRLIEKNIGLDNMLAIHKHIGMGAVILLTLHPLLLFLHELIVFNSLRMMWARWIGLIALVIIWLTSITALYFKKLKMRYEAWKYIHYVNYLVFPFVLIHVFFNATFNTVTYYLWVVYGICFFVIFAHKIYSVYKIRKNPYTLADIKENNTIWTLEFKGKAIDHLPGQFLYVQLAGRHSIFQSNPFTIVSSPTFENIMISMKELGDLTSQAKDLKLGDTAYIDAPYGVFSYKLYDSDNLVFIAGGIGITPYLSMLRYMKDNDDVHSNVILIWGNQSENDLIFLDELEKYEKILKNFRMILVMSDQDDWPGNKGFIDKELIQKYIDEPRSYKFLICGPKPLLQLMKEDLKALGVEKKDIHYESFDF